MTSSQTPRYNN